ncbi:Uma2 family endonuclease [Trichothermofontia sp.]
MPASAQPPAPQAASPQAVSPAALLTSEVESLQTIWEELASQGITLPPSDLESDEPPLESDLHRSQIDLLIRLIHWLWREGQATPPPNYRSDYYVSGNITIYYSPNRQKTEKFRGPDFFVVLGTENRPRKSWMLWEENGQYPHVIVELLSPSTAMVDRGLKKQLYQDTFRTPEYFWFDPYSLEFAGFYLVHGTYEPIAPTAQGWLWSQQLQLYLGVHQGQLRFFTQAGELVPTPEEAAAAERQRAEAERQRAEAIQQRNEALAAKLRELGIDPDQEV